MTKASDDTIDSEAQEKFWFPTIAKIGAKYREAAIDRNQQQEINCVQDLMNEVGSLIAQEANRARIDPFDFVEPCEPDCTPERHAYHRGQWDMAGRINKHFGLLPHPGALTAEKGKA